LEKGSQNRLAKCFT